MAREGPGTPDSSLDWEYLHADDFREGSPGERTPVRSPRAVVGGERLFQHELAVSTRGSLPRSPVSEPSDVPSPAPLERGPASVASPNSVRSLNADGLVSEPASDTESHYTNDLMAAGEPEDEAIGSPMSRLSSAADLERLMRERAPGPSGPPSVVDEDLGSGAATPVPPLGLAARAYLATADQLAVATASVARLLRAVGALSERATCGAWLALVDLVETLRRGLVRATPAGLGAAPLLASLRSSLLRGQERVAGVIVRAQDALAGEAKPAFKRAGAARRRLLDHWPVLALAAGCAAASAALYRSVALNARLAARLSQREAELAELVSRIMALQRSMTRQHSARGVPMIAHASCASASWHHAHFGASHLHHGSFGVV